MKVTIDRFEDSFAVCEKDDRSMMNIKRSLIPEEAKEGDVLDIQGEEISIDLYSTEKRKKDIEELTKDLWK